MRLDRTFIRLALRVDAAKLAAEVAALPESAWIPHPEGAPGNTCVPLVAAGGNHLDHATTGAMAPTAVLAQMPYHRSVLAALGAPIGRTRLMRIEPEGRLGLHVDTNRYWQEHLRVHAPIVTSPDVQFTCDEEAVHMAPGEVWVFDTWRRHGVDNPSTVARVHLVIDTVGSSALWARIREGEQHGVAGEPIGDLVGDGGESAGEPTYESAEPLGVTAPWLHRVLADGIERDLPADAPMVLRHALRDFVADWHALWVVHRDDPAARPLYDTLAARFDRLLGTLPGAVLANDTRYAEAVRQHLLRPSVTPLAGEVRPQHRPAPWSNAKAATPDAAPTAPTAAPARGRLSTGRRLDRPVFIVCSPRSGSSLLFESLARAKGLFTIGGESHEVFERIAELHPSNRGWRSNELTAADVEPAIATRLDETFAARARDRDGRVPQGRRPIRLLEKTPKNALRVRFLAEAFPDAGFIYLHREPKPTISSMLDAWRSEKFVTYRGLPGWGNAPWSMLLVPGWEDYIGRPLEEVAALQWATTVSSLMDALSELPPERWCAVRHEEMLADPNGVVGGLAERIGLEWDRPLPAQLPNSKTTLDAPADDKWRRNEEAIDRVWPQVSAVAARADEFIRSAAGTMAMAAPSHARQQRAEQRIAAVRAAGNQAFRSVHTASVAELLGKAARSLIVSTYQSGRVVLLRTGPDGSLNTHLRAFPRPMGVAIGNGSLALGTSNSVWQFDDQPALAQRLPGGVPHDACYVARRAQVTGDIAIHEMAYDAAGELWVVNTRFSCLATLDDEYSFVPRWRPRFVTALAAEDRCHLNGLAMVDGRPKYVTAMAMTDERQGWRREKLGGGLIIDVDDHAVVTQGMTMPHSPRWHGGKLWVLDSGNGALCSVDIATGNRTDVALLPGFTRGLAFIGRYALVGLSKVREHVFAGLPLAERVTERQCGVWVVDTVTGAIAGFLRFDGAVEEVFDVQMAPHRYPELLEPTDALGAGAFLLPEDTEADLRAAVTTEPRPSSVDR